MDKDYDQDYYAAMNKQFNFLSRDGRIEFALRQAQTNESQAAQKLKFAQSSLNSYRHMRTKRFLRLPELAAYLGVNAVWLHSGEGSPFLGSGKDTNKLQSYSINMNKAFFDNHYSKQYPDKTFEELTIHLPVSDLQKLNSNNLGYILMPDDSMEDEIKYGSIVIIDESDTYIENGKLYALMVYDNVTIRRIYQINKNITLKVNNQNTYQDDQIDRDHIEASGLEILGKIRLVKNYYM